MSSLSNSQRQNLLSELDALRRFCLSLTGNNHDADDLLQMTVERLLDKGMPDDAHTLKWGYRVCRNIWIDELRSREVRQRYVKSDTEQDANIPSAQDSAEQEHQMATIAAALNKLPEDQQMALTLVAIEGRTYAETAVILQIPVGTVMSRISRARRNLTDLLNDTTSASSDKRQNQ